MGSGLEVVSQFCLLTPRDRFVDLSVGDFGFDTCIVIALMSVYSNVRVSVLNYFPSVLKNEIDSWL